MTFTKIPKIPVRKSKEDIQFYKDNGPAFNEILGVLENLVRKELIKDIEKAFEDLCYSRFGPDVGYPFREQENYFGEPFGHSVCVSINDVVAHGRPVRPLTNDIVSVDCGISLPHNGRRLNFDAAFTTIRGRDKIPNWVKAPRIALASIVDRQPRDTKAVSSIIQSVAGGYDIKIVVSLVGHGIGYTLHEEPIIHNALGPFQAVELFDGLVFCAEPIFVNPGSNEDSSAIAPTCIGADGWEVSTISGQPSTHFETMFGVSDGQVVDLIGVSEWEL